MVIKIDFVTLRKNGTMKVICINDKSLPEGAEVVSGKDYVVERTFTNNFGQRAHIIKGIKNEGITPRGLHWHGYAIERFAQLDKNPVEVSEEEILYNPMLN